MISIWAALARADGGAVRASVPVGPLQVTVFTAPTPPVAGTLDVSAMVQRRADHGAVLDAAVSVRAWPAADPAAVRGATATREAAANKLLYAAALPVDAGRWSVEVAVRSGDVAGTASFEIDVEPAPPPWLAFWPYLALPAAAVALFVLHQRLGAR